MELFWPSNWTGSHSRSRWVRFRPAQSEQPWRRTRRIESFQPGA
jgi:hypothetical protein